MQPERIEELSNTTKSACMEAIWFLGDVNVTNKQTNKQTKQGVCHIGALPFTSKSILMQKKNYGNSNIFTMQKYNLQKIL